MAILKRIRAATLMETMVATVLIVVIFMMSSLVLNSLFKAQVKANLSPLKNRMYQLEYQYYHQKIALPFYEVWNQWEITMDSIPQQKTVRIAAHPENNPDTQTLQHTFYHAETH